MILTFGVGNLSHLVLINNMQRVENLWTKKITKIFYLKLTFQVGNFLNLLFINNILNVHNFYPGKFLSKHINMGASFDNLVERAIHLCNQILIGVIVWEMKHFGFWN
jgi:hypothetical protein